VGVISPCRLCVSRVVRRNVLRVLVSGSLRYGHVFCLSHARSKHPIPTLSFGLTFAFRAWWLFNYDAQRLRHLTAGRHILPSHIMTRERRRHIVVETVKLLQVLLIDDTTSTVGLV
jgi:hypothetical protein